MTSTNPAATARQFQDGEQVTYRADPAGRCALNGADVTVEGAELAGDGEFAAWAYRIRFGGGAVMAGVAETRLTRTPLITKVTVRAVKRRAATATASVHSLTATSEPDGTVSLDLHQDSTGKVTRFRLAGAAWAQLTQVPATAS
jgi:hypothetical protein